MKQKKHKGLFVGILLGVITLVAFGSTFFIYRNKSQSKGDEKTLKVVTSFYPMYIATQNITDGVGNLELVSLSEPQTGCLHDYQLTPEDMKLLATADVFVVNGGGIESFLTEVASAYPEVVIVNASEGLDVIEDNPHAWMSVGLYQKQVQNITEALAEVDEANGEIYRKNGQVYVDKLAELDQEIQQVKSEVNGENVVIFHEAYEYLAQDLGLQVVYTMDLDEERQVSAGEVKDVMSAIMENRVRFVFAEENYGKEMGEKVTEETPARTIYLDPLVRGTYEKDSYVEHMRANIQDIRMGFAGR